MPRYPTHATYRRDSHGLNKYLNQEPSIRAYLRKRAVFGVKVAKALAPVGPDETHRKFRDSIHVAPVDNKTRHPRWGIVPGVKIIADADHAVAVEFGRRRRMPYRGSYTMTRMARYLQPPRRYGN